MNKLQISAALARRASIPKFTASAHVNIVIDAIQEALVRGEAVTVMNFGVFTVITGQALTGNNHEGSTLPIAGVRTPRFRASTRLKHALNPW